MVLSTLIANLDNTDEWGDYQATNQATQDQSSTEKAYWLNQFGALKISGPDAERFLQGQLTCNLNDLDTETVHYGACCNAKGRIVANFIISFDDESYWLILPSNSALVLEKHLQKYKVFFKADIENCQNSHKVFGLIDSQSDNSRATDDTLMKAEHTTGYHKLKLSPQRQLLLIDSELDIELPEIASTIDWHLMDIQQGIYFVEQDQIEKWIPQHINWHSLNGISFNKGCYTGQEIIARLQYLGKAKKALHHFCLNLAKDKFDTKLSKTTQLFDEQGKSQAEVLFNRYQEANGQLELHLLAVMSPDNEEKALYLTESTDFPLTLQNLSYTEEKTV